MMRDDRFFLTPEPEDDSTWFPAQLLACTSDMPITGNDENIVNMLRLFLAMACSQACTLNGRILLDILARCGKREKERKREGMRKRVLKYQIAPKACAACIFLYCTIDIILMICQSTASVFGTELFFF